MILCANIRVIAEVIGIVIRVIVMILVIKRQIVINTKKQ